MTINGAIMQLVEMRENSMMPMVFKPYFDKVIETISECEEPHSQPQWIPCSESVPNKPSGDEYYWCSSHKADLPACEYIVMIKGAELPTALFWDGCHWFDINGNETLYPVVAWMPFPKPYEG